MKPRPKTSSHRQATLRCGSRAPRPNKTWPIRRSSRLMALPFSSRRMSGGRNYSPTMVLSRFKRRSHMGVRLPMSSARRQISRWLSRLTTLKRVRREAMRIWAKLQLSNRNPKIRMVKTRNSSTRLSQRLTMMCLISVRRRWSFSSRGPGRF